MDADRAFAQETAARGVEGWVAFFAEDGKMFPPEGIATGKDAKRDARAGSFSDPGRQLTWEPSSAVVSAPGDLAYTLGRWELLSTETTGSAGVLARGNYVTIWRREPDGSWKVVVDIGNNDPASE